MMRQIALELPAYNFAVRFHDQFLRIVLVGNVAQQNALQPTAVFGQQMGGFLVGKMARGGLDPLLRPRRVKPVPQHFRVVIALEQHPVQRVENLRKRRENAAQIGADPEPFSAVIDHEAHAVRRVVGRGDRLDPEVFELEPCVGAEMLNVSRDFQPFRPHRLARAERHPDRDLELSVERVHARRVVEVVVRHEQRVRRPNIDPEGGKAVLGADAADPRVEKKARPAALDVNAVPAAPGLKGDDFHLPQN